MNMHPYDGDSSRSATEDNRLVVPVGCCCTQYTSANHKTPPLIRLPVEGRPCPACRRKMKWKKCPFCRLEVLCLPCHTDRCSYKPERWALSSYTKARLRCLQTCLQTISAYLIKHFCIPCRSPRLRICYPGDLLVCASIGYWPRDLLVAGQLDDRPLHWH